MRSFASKLNYLARSVAKTPFAANSVCLNCGCGSGYVLDRKYAVTRLVRCDGCALLFRAPTDSEAFSRKFYNFSYVEGTTTQYPALEDLRQQKIEKFNGTEQDYEGFIAFLEHHGIRPPARLLDFGCSWGYGSYQFSTAGFDTSSFEIAEDRRKYGMANLGVRHIDDMFEVGPQHPLAGTFDCFFSAHVLEHVPSPSKVIELAWHCLKDGGAFVAFTPNGCDAFRKYNPRSWSNMWGEVHPNYLDDVFYEIHFANSRKLIAARDRGDVMKQYELGFVAWKDASKGRF